MANSIAQGTSRLLSAGEAARMLGVTGQTIRNYCRAGELEFVLTLGGHRRVTLASLRRWLGEDPEPNDERGAAIYARVSTNRQRREGNLSRQVDRLVEFCHDAYGLSKKNVLVIDETGSGLNENRKGYLRLVDLILSGKISRVVVEHRDRLARYGVRLFEALCERMVVSLITTNAKSEDSSSESEMASDIISLITVYSARVHGQRGGDASRIVITDEAKSKILELSRQGLPHTGIAAHIKAEELRCPKTGRIYSVHAVRLTLQENEQIQRVLGGPTNTIDQFISEKCIRDESAQCFSRPFAREYNSWAEAQGLVKANSNGLTKAVKRLGYKTQRTGSGYVYFKGFRLRDNERASRSHLG